MSRAALGFACALALSLAGCINEETRLYEVVLEGEVGVAPGAPSEGAVHLQFHVARTFGEGDLAHPLGEFDRRTIAGVGPVRETLLHPRDVGEGLVVYGWLDSDGDGIHCAPGQTEEPAGLVEVAGFPAHALSFSLTLSAPCVGPESLYP
ncbi:hypothetical protein [Polyangium spumosum]|uniref:Lipoprotein n=1 Tax=Polyangium spumosum TaxID=889282 RepID=A0A6N7PPF7_9BACT|nr:hypothetical protein [Polyangium spumosum]MRG93507.1 hypothetical protein [Polyangium spumosum]